MDIWARIFSLNCHDDWYFDLGDLSEAMNDQECFLSLPIVCQKFKATFDSNPQLYSVVIVNKDFDNDNLPILLNWVARRCKHLTHVVAATYGATQELVLAVLYSCTNYLTKIDLRATCQQSVSLLSAFKSVTDCTLDLDGADHLSLRGLHHLDQLTRLAISGGLDVCPVSDMDAAEHLTCLDLFHCEAVCAQHSASASSLLHLIMAGSSLTNFHPQGILGCTALQFLDFDNAAINASSPDEDFAFNRQKVSVASGLSALTLLTDLHFKFNYERHVESLHFMSALQSLQSLRIGLLGGPVKFALPRSLTVLSKLEALSVNVFGSYYWFDCHFNWAALPVLRTVDLSAAVEVSAGLKDLVALSTFRGLCVRQSTKVNGDGTKASTAPWVAFANWLGTQRPDVVLSYSE